MRSTLLVLLVATAAFANGKITWERAMPGQPSVPITMWCKNGNGRMETGGDKKIAVIWDADKKLLSILHPDLKVYEQIDPAKFATLTGAKPGAADDTSYTATGKKQKVEKWDCEVYKVKRGAMDMEMCMVPWAKAPVKKEELGCLKSVSEAFRLMGAKDNDGAAGDFDKMPGMPVQTRRDLGDGSSNVTTFKSWEKADAPADAFTIPGDYVVRGRGPAK